MNKSLLLTLFLSQFVQAGSLITCPDLEKKEASTGWLVTGQLQKVPFENVLISVSRVLGSNTVTCKYQDSLSLSKVGNFQPAASAELWERIIIGGISFKQCLSNIVQCRFFTVKEVL